MNHTHLKHLEFSSDSLEQLRAYCNAHDRLTKEHTRLTNRLICALRRYFPLLDGLFSSSAPKIALKILLRYPSWRDLREVAEEDLINFLKDNHYRNTKNIQRVISKIKSHTQEVSPQVEAAYQIEAQGIAENLLNTKKRLNELEVKKSGTVFYRLMI